MRRALIASIALTAMTLAGPAASAAAAHGAHAAKSVSLVEVGRLKLVNEEGSTVYERGSARGTYAGSVTATFVIHAKSVVVTVALHARGGTISGVARANYKVVKKLGYFGGTLTLRRGTGRYSHIAAIGGKEPGFSGIINRDTLETEVKVNGTVRM